MTDHPLLSELDDYVAAYEQARDGPASARIEDYLPPQGDSLFFPVLRELVRVEMELSWRDGSPSRLADYLRAYPFLGDDPDSLPEIAYEEYRLRLLAGEQPTPEEYARSFGVRTEGWYVPCASSRPEPLVATCVLSDPRLPAGSQEHAFTVTPDVEAGNGVPDPGDGFPEVGEVVAGFKLVGELGRGSFGRVYLAEQEQLSARPVALKLSPATFVGEAHTLARLQHTHIVPIYSLHRASGRVAICMPYLGGRTLDHFLRELRREPELPRSGKWLTDRLGPREATAPALERLARSSYVDAVLWMIARLAEALAHAHERGIVHRDLKPANVLLAADGTPMLLDFNLAQEYQAAALVGGTLAYMAPEYLAQLRGEGPRSEPRHDVYALGLVLWEMLAGRLPHPRREDGLLEVLSALIADRKQPPTGLMRANPAVTPAVEAIARRCLEPVPDQRYQTAAELREDVERHLANLPLRHAREPVSETWRKWRRRHPKLASASTVAALAFLVVAALVVWQMGREGSRRVLEARSAASELRRDVDASAFLLAAPDADPALLLEGMTRLEAQARRYGALQDGWQHGPLVRALPEPERQDVLMTVGEMLWLWGRARGWAARSPEERAEARAVLRRAAGCYAAGAAPPVLAREEARLWRLDGNPSEAGRAESEERPAATPREHYLALLDQVGARRYREVLPLLREAARRDGGSPTTWLLLARAYGELGQFDLAHEFGEMATAAAPDWPWSWYHQGLTLLTAQKFAEARRCFDRVVQLRPGLAEARLHRALACLQSGDARAAIADLDAALEMESPPTRIYFLRSLARQQLGDPSGARADHAEGLRREPADELSWIARAVARLPGEPAKALADLDRALARNPTSPQALQNKAHVLSEHFQQLPDAVACLDKLLDLRPTDALARAGRAVLLARQGKRAEAHRDAKAVADDARDAGLIYQAACAYALTAAKHAEDVAEAVRLLRRAFQLEERWIQVAERDPDLDALRGKEAFRGLARQAKGWYSSRR